MKERKKERKKERNGTQREKRTVTNNDLALFVVYFFLVQHFRHVCEIQIFSFSIQNLYRMKIIYLFACGLIHRCSTSASCSLKTTQHWQKPVPTRKIVSFGIKFRCFIFN